MTGRRERNRQTWERLGRENPYWGVLSGDAYDGVTDEALPEEFWASGERYVESIWERLRLLDQDFALEVAVDFGCGVGRIALPLADRVSRVYGIDVSAGMRELTGAEAAQRGLTNVEVVDSVGSLALLSGEVDLVHSCLVFQHIPVDAGLAAADQLLALLRPGGWGVLQFYLGRDVTPWRRSLGHWRARSRLVNSVVSLTRGRLTMKRLPYEMNEYPMRRLLDLTERYGSGPDWIDTEIVEDATGVTMFVQRSAD